MFKHTIIRSVAAVILLVLLVTGVTPKRYLHDWFANHHDRIPTGQTLDGKQHLTYSGFNCDNDNTVATSPFTSVATYRVPGITAPYPIYRPAMNCAVTSLIPLFQPLRGPPSFC